jgi:hypothetical protein
MATNETDHLADPGKDTRAIAMEIATDIIMVTTAQRANRVTNNRIIVHRAIAPKADLRPFRIGSLITSIQTMTATSQRMNSKRRFKNV